MSLGRKGGRSRVSSFFNFWQKSSRETRIFLRIHVEGGPVWDSSRQYQFVLNIGLSKEMRDYPLRSRRVHTMTFNLTCMQPTSRHGIYRSLPIHSTRAAERRGNRLPRYGMIACSTGAAEELRRDKAFGVVELRFALIGIFVRSSRPCTPNEKRKKRCEKGVVSPSAANLDWCLL